MSPSYYCLDNLDDALELWNKIAEEECIEYLLYELRKTGFDFQPGEKTRQLFKQLLRDFSVAQIYGIIYRSVANASKYYMQPGVTKKRAANSVIGRCRRYAEKAIFKDWELTQFVRRKDLPQSELSAFYFNRVLRIGEKGFQEKPSIHLLQKDNIEE